MPAAGTAVPRSTAVKIPSIGESPNTDEKVCEFEAA